MEKFIPFGKLSKKKQKELNKAKRNTWGLTNPATKCSKNQKAYNRKKLRSKDFESSENGVYFFAFR